MNKKTELEKRIIKAQKKEAKRIAKQIVKDRQKSDDELLNEALEAFDIQHNTGNVIPNSLTVRKEKPQQVSDVEVNVSEIINKYFGKDPSIDLSISMSLLMTTLSRMGGDPEVCEYLINILTDMKNGGSGGAYQINNTKGNE